MDSFKRQAVNVNARTDVIEFQALSWRGYDIDERYTISICGVTNKGDTIGVTVDDFDPYFYIQPPPRIAWTSAHSQGLEAYLTGI